jgi:hypothetical protein
VCGCNNVSYGNDCERRAAGVSKLHDGECNSMNQIIVGEGQSCGGFTLPPVRVCGQGMWCEPRQMACGLADAPGTCRRVPEACLQIYSPVCGCDNRTYGNDCERQGAGVALARTGPCKEMGRGRGEMCGGIAGFACAQGLVCDFFAGSCDGADAAGTCVDAPSGVCGRDFRPVCGCDGRTYGNDCLRLSAGVAKARDGECRPPVQLLPSGVWGGEHIELTVRNPSQGASVRFDCGSGSITGPLELQPDGSFKWRGTYTPGGGPVMIDPAVNSRGATFVGRTGGGSMSLEIHIDGWQEVPNFKLSLNMMANLFLCL